MTAALESPAPSGFKARTMLVMAFVGLFAFSAFAVLSTYAPELRSGQDGGAHALSKSATGFAGAVVLLRARGTPVVISRAPDLNGSRASLVILTPSPFSGADDLKRLLSPRVTLIVLPKWAAAPDPLRRGWVRNVGLLQDDKMAGRLLGGLAKSSTLAYQVGVTRPVLRLAPGNRVTHPSGAPMDLTALRTGPIDRLQTLSGEGWAPVITDQAGHMVVAASLSNPQTYVLADPDLLNTQGLASLDTARVGVTILDALRSDMSGVVFDVSLAGYGRTRSVGKLMLEPPILGATLCAAAAALLMGLHGMVRFGPARAASRGLALGALGLVDNSAGLIRLGRKEAELAQPYAELTQTMTLRATGGGRAGDRLERLERLARTTTNRADLAQATALVKTPADLLAIARRWRLWRLEMTRDRR